MPVTLQETFTFKHARPGKEMAWAPRLRARFAYHSPDDHYENLLLNLVTEQTRWLDIGAGDRPCSSDRVSRLLSDRCPGLVGLDPCSNLQLNPYVHERHQTTIEDFEPAQRFDLLTLRMVAEHVRDPESFTKSLVRLAAPDARIVIFTVWKHSPGAVLARVSPFELHHPVKKWLWQSQERDTFPVFYRMNTPQTLARLFRREGVVQKRCWLIDDCRTLGCYRMGLKAELTMRSWLNRFGMAYPERCLIGLYEVRPE